VRVEDSRTEPQRGHDPAFGPAYPAGSSQPHHLTPYGDDNSDDDLIWPPIEEASARPPKPGSGFNFSAGTPVDSENPMAEPTSVLTPLPSPTPPAPSSGSGMGSDAADPGFGSAAPTGPVTPGPAPGAPGPVPGADPTPSGWAGPTGFPPPFGPPPS